MRSSSPRFYDPVRSFFHKISMGDGCWRWLANTDRRGYGHLTIKGKAVQAHRFAYELFVGPPGDLFVLHRCDNPACVRPDHLWLGTHADNMADMKTKNRAHRRPSPDLCPAGHDDWIVRASTTRTFRRRCRTCAREQNRRSYALRRLIGG